MGAVKQAMLEEADEEQRPTGLFCPNCKNTLKKSELSPEYPHYKPCFDCAVSQEIGGDDA